MRIGDGLLVQLVGFNFYSTDSPICEVKFEFSVPGDDDFFDPGNELLFIKTGKLSACADASLIRSPVIFFASQNLFPLLFFP